MGLKNEKLVSICLEKGSDGVTPGFLQRGLRCQHKRCRPGTNLNIK
jgi:hypothetical protein